jgi:hypothetical protein
MPAQPASFRQGEIKPNENHLRSYEAEVEACINETDNRLTRIRGCDVAIIGTFPAVYVRPSLACREHFVI